MEITKHQDGSPIIKIGPEDGPREFAGIVILLGKVLGSTEQKDFWDDWNGGTDVYWDFKPAEGVTIPECSYLNIDVRKGTWEARQFNPESETPDGFEVSGVEPYPVIAKGTFADFKISTT